MPATDALTLCASDVPVTFRLSYPREPSDPVTLPCSVWLVGPPVQLPNEYKEHPTARTLFKFVMGEDPGRKLGQQLVSGDRVEWNDLVLITLGTVMPMKVGSQNGSGPVPAWMLFAELIM